MAVTITVTGGSVDEIIAALTRASLDAATAPAAETIPATPAETIPAPAPRRGRPAKIAAPAPAPIPAAAAPVGDDPFAPSGGGDDPFAPSGGDGPSAPADEREETISHILTRIADKLPQSGEAPLVKFLAPQFGLSSAASYGDVLNAIRGATDVEKLKKLLAIMGGPK